VIDDEGADGVADDARPARVRQGDVERLARLRGGGGDDVDVDDLAGLAGAEGQRAGGRAGEIRAVGYVLRAAGPEEVVDRGRAGRVPRTRHREGEVGGRARALVL